MPLYRKKFILISDLLFALIVTVLITAPGCCRAYYSSLPARPVQVDGWKQREEGTLLTLGSFVLNKGETTENKKLGITFVGFEAARICSTPLSEPSPAKVRLRFYTPSDQHTLCETTILIPNGALSGGGNLDCSDTAPPGFSIRSYNPKEEWIWLEISTTKGDTRW
jgi:hypothetical protein